MKKWFQSGGGLGVGGKQVLFQSAESRRKSTLQKPQQLIYGYCCAIFAVTREPLYLRSHVRYCKNVVSTSIFWGVGDEFLMFFVTSNQGKTKKAV